MRLQQLFLNRPGKAGKRQKQRRKETHMTDLLRCRAEAIAWPLVSLDAFRHASPLIHREVLGSSFRLRLQQLGLGRDEELAQWAWGDKKFVFEHLRYHASKLLYDNGACM